ncbi:uncharacterized protein LOC143240664 isoform X2 [Tachypleus tridentatus]|uniref:uncharacterized protein LOC143240664 isoform X2 n=1 Tax=Tachypleus tridentatus TaxID=6853 RepID=UPI003FCF53EB
MLITWDEISQKFHKASQVLQNEDVNLKTLTDLYGSLADQLYTLMNDFERFEAVAKETLPDVDYNAAEIRKRVKKKILSDRGAQGVDLNTRDKFRVTTFCTIVDKLEIQMTRRGEVCKEIANRFSFLSDVPNDVASSAETERILSVPKS